MRFPPTVVDDRVRAGDAGRVWAGVDPEAAGLVGRIQCGLIGSRRLAIAYRHDTAFTVLAAAAARAFGAHQVVAVLHPVAAGADADVDDAWALAQAAGVELVRLADLSHRTGLALDPADRAPRAGHRGRVDRREHGPWHGADLGELGVDTLAHPCLLRPDAPEPARLAAAPRHRVLRPLLDAGLTREDVDAVAGALGLPVCPPPVAQGARA